MQKKCRIQLDEELVCNSCNTMTTEDSCKKLGNVIFTTLVNWSKIEFNVQPTLIATAFKGTLQNYKKSLSWRKVC